jgi:hypothetical protein
MAVRKWCALMPNVSKLKWRPKPWHESDAFCAKDTALDNAKQPEDDQENNQSPEANPAALKARMIITAAAENGDQQDDDEECCE